MSLLDLGLFDGGPKHELFPLLKDIAPNRMTSPSSSPHPFGMGRPIALPPTYQFGGAARSSEKFLVDTDTVALLVLHGRRAL